MKRLLQIALLLSISLFGACQDDVIDDNIGDEFSSQELKINISDGKIKSPSWLVTTIDTVARRYNKSPGTGSYPYPWVYQMNYDGEEFVYVADGLSSCLTCGTLFFTKKGDPVNPDTELYKQLFSQKTWTLVWHEGMREEVNTRADVLASIYTPNGTRVNDCYYLDEFSDAQKAASLAEAKRNYPNAIVMGEATRTYNCHAYAWHVSEGGEHVWMGSVSNPTSVYWNDGSYVGTIGKLG